MKRVAVFITNGSEDIEAVLPADVWVRAGLSVDFITIEQDFAVQLAQKTNIIADKLLENTNLDNYDIYYIPGGDILDNFQSGKETKLKTYLQQNIHDKHKTFVALCAAPFLFNKWGLLDNSDIEAGRKIITYAKHNSETNTFTTDKLYRIITNYPGVETGVFDEKRINTRTVIDQNIITGNGPGSSFSLAYAVLDYLGMQDKSKELQSAMQWSKNYGSD
jgi:4-methyl-5(b-hydroxyethyl)-thiazole monophosphate biosynthesis